MTEFAANLLDGFDLLYRRTDDVLKSTTEFSGFFKKLSLIETTYAKELQKLAQTVKSKKAGIEIGTVKDAWENIHSELESVGNKHQQLGMQLQNDLSVPIGSFVKEKEAVRKKLVTDGTKLSTDMSNQMKLLQKTKLNYINLCKAADKAQQDFQKAKTEPGNVKPKEINKLNSKAAKALELAQASDKEYAKTLKQTNEKQATFYNSEMPSLLKEFQAFEEDRIQFLKSNLQKFSSFYNEFPPFVEKVSKSIEKCANNIDVPSDIKLFVQQNKTNVSPPSDILFEKYQSENNFAVGGSGGGGGGSAPPASLNRASSSAGIPLANSGGNKFARAENTASRDFGLSAADESLSNDERAAKLQVQLNDLKEAIKGEQKSKKGLEKLVKFYQSDPQAQEKARGELEEQKKKIAGMKDRRSELETQIAQLTGVELGDKGGGSNAEEDNPSEDNPHDSHDAEPEHAKAKALYDYEATNDTELSFKEGDILTITEQDESGWWFAELNGANGFVPNNYIQLMP